MSANDITILAGFFGFFIILGFLLPFVANDLGISGVDSHNAPDIDNSVGVFDIVASIASVFFWTFGALPLWMDLALWIIRATMYILLARVVVHGGA